MKRLKNWRVGIVAIVLAIGGVFTPLALMADTALATDNVTLIGDYTGLKQGFSNIDGGEFADHGAATNINFYFEGTVQSTGGQCWPFACGNGANAYFQGDNVWVLYDHGTNICLTATNDEGDAGFSWSARYTASACGGGHTYSYIVQHKAFDGRAGSASWADVGATNANGGKGMYLYILQSYTEDEFRPSAPAVQVSFHTGAA